MTGNKLFKAVAAGIVLAAATTGAAHAVPSYAYANLNFTNFTLGGVFTNPNVTINGVPSVSSQDASNYPGFGSAGTTTPGNVTTGTDVPQATTGPGPFPGENTFTQFMLPASALAPAGTRGDAQVTGPLGGGATSHLVAEGKLSQPNAGAGSSSATGTGINITFTAGAGAGVVTLTFNASSMVQAIVHDLGDSAFAQDHATFQIFDLTGGGPGTPILITDNINPANSSTLIAPDALNAIASSTNPATPNTFTSPSTAYSYTSAPLINGHTYQISLQDSTTIQLSTGSAAIPEPASLGLLGSGIMAIGLLRRRRNNKN